MKPDKPDEQHDLLETGNGGSSEEVAIEQTSESQSKKKKKPYEKPVVRDIDLNFLSLEL